MPSLRIVALAAAFLTAVAWSAGAADPKPFTAKELNKLLADYPAFAAFMASEGEAIEQAGRPEAWEGVRVSSRMADYLKKKGWEPERFFYVISHVGAGLVAVTLEEEAPRVQAGLAEAEAEIRDNPYFSEEMKKQLLDQMRQSVAEVKKLDQAGKEIPEEELKLIRKNRERILKVFDIDEP